MVAIPAGCLQAQLRSWTRGYWETTLTPASGQNGTWNLGPLDFNSSTLFKNPLGHIASLPMKTWKKKWEKKRYETLLSVGIQYCTRWETSHGLYRSKVCVKCCSMVIIFGHWFLTILAINSNSTNLFFSLYRFL